MDGWSYEWWGAWAKQSSDNGWATKIDICEISGCSKNKGSKVNGGQLTVVWKFPFAKVGILWWTTHSLGQWNMQAKPIMLSLENISSSLVFTGFPNIFFLSYVWDCYKLVGHLIIIFYGYPSPGLAFLR